jgi:hypothetical protein
MEVLNNSGCGHHRFGGGTVSGAELTEQMFGREYTPMFLLMGRDTSSVSLSLCLYTSPLNELI